MSEHPVKRRKKLIEVAIPLDGINKASIHEKMPGISQHPRGIHHWWARRPFGAARAILFAQLVDDPSSIPELFPDSASQEAERDRLFAITEKLASWNNTWNRELLDDAKTEITKSWSRACEDNKSNPLAHELFDKKCLPGFHDPFAGGGAIPLEAQRLGLRSYATDLNPIPTLINKALLEIPGRVSGFPSVAPRINKQTKLQVAHPSSIDGFLEDIAYYSDWMLGRAKERIGDLYPPVTVTQDMCSAQPKLDALLGSSLKVVTWLWVRTRPCRQHFFFGQRREVKYL
jgi:putative DNA methylase